MKKIFLVLFLILTACFINCSVDPDKPYILEKKVIHVTPTTFDGLEGKILIWEGPQRPANDFYESSYQAMSWFLYPAEQIPENITGHKIRLIYKIKKLKKLPVIRVMEIEILDKST